MVVLWYLTYESEQEAFVYVRNELTVKTVYIAVVNKLPVYKISMVIQY